MPGWLGKKNKGQTTVFLSLALVLIISLICTLLESARSEGLRLRLQTAANAAIASAFSMYDIQVWERYGLLFFADRIGNGQEFREVVDRYTGLNTREDDAVGGDWISFSEASSADISYVLATDDHGEVFVRAVCTYMRQCGLIREIKDMQEQWNSAREKISGLDLTNSEGELDLGRIGNLLEQVQEGLKSSVEMYLESGRNIQKAAGKMNIHKNTLRYRLERAQELFDFDLSDENTCFNFQFSLRMRRMIR